MVSRLCSCLGDLAARVGNSATADKDSSGSRTIHKYFAFLFVFFKPFFFFVLATTIYGDVTIVDSETGGDYTKINVNQADGDYTGDHHL